VDLFLSSWRKEPSGANDFTAPRVQRVFALRPPAAVQERFKAYAARAGNVHVLFHGTGLDDSCSFGVDINRPPCAAASCCSVCNICREGFRLRHAGVAPTGGGRRMNLRYGRGLYFSATSGKSNDYAASSERRRPVSVRVGGGGGGRRGGGKRRSVATAAPWRVMFVCQVAVGRTHRTTSGHIGDDELKLILEAKRGEEGASAGMVDENGEPRQLSSSLSLSLSSSSSSSSSSGSSRAGMIDSITGVVKPEAERVGDDLNYDEVVTYSEASAMPNSSWPTPWCPPERCPRARWFV
jgi:hypothetical protein